MVREYIVKIADDVTEDDDVLYGKPAKELIRCKDCTYREACDEGYAEPLIVDGLIWCELHEISREPGYFCADGRRKDGDGN